MRPWMSVDEMLDARAEAADEMRAADEWAAYEADVAEMIEAHEGEDAPQVPDFWTWRAARKAAVTLPAPPPDFGDDDISF